MALAARLLLLAQNGNPGTPSVPTHIGFSCSQLISTVPAGQAVGSLSVTGGVGPFSYTGSNPKFTISGTSVIRGIIGSLVPGGTESFDFTVTDGNGNSYTTVGNQGPFLVPVIAPSAMAVPVKLTNLNAGASAVAPFVTFGMAFKDGDFPPGGSVTLLDSTGASVVAQTDAVGSWPSGNGNVALVSVKCPETWIASAQKTYTIGTSPVPPNTTPAAGWGANVAAWKAALIANSDIKAIYTGQDCGANTYTVSVNSILNNYSQRLSPNGWGSNNPTGGWEITKQGPLCITWHAWQFLKNDAGPNHFHGYAKCDIWVKAWSPTGPFEIDVKTSSGNIWNAIDATSEQYNAMPKRFAAYLQVKDGAATLKYDGGVNDTNSTVIANADFNTTTKKVVGPNILPQTGFILTAGTSLPTGLVANQLYWLASYNGVDDCYICTQQIFCGFVQQGYGRDPWMASHAYNVGDNVQNGNILYYCITAGTSASSGGPTGGGVGSNITDGTVHWTNMTIGFTSQGVGTLTAHPVSMCFPGTAWNTADDNGDSLWSGAGSRPQMAPGPDIGYLCQQSKYSWAMNPAAGGAVTNLVAPTYLPNRHLAGLEFAQSHTGAGAFDARIGPMNYLQAASIFLPEDPYYYKVVIQGALVWDNAPFQAMMDEKGNSPLNCGKVTLPQSATPIPDWVQYNVCGSTKSGVVPRGAQWTQWDPALQNANGLASQYYGDPTHVPMNSQVAYMKTGREVFLESGISQAVNYTCMVYLGYQSITVGLTTTTYYPLIEGNYYSSQIRGWAWALGVLCQALFLCPDSHYYKPVLASTYDENIAYEAARIQHVYPAAEVAAGVPQVFGHGSGLIPPWMLYFLHGNFARELWRGGQTSTAGANLAIIGNFLKNYWKNFLPSVNAGAVNYYGAYDLRNNLVEADWANTLAPGLATLQATAAAGAIPPLWINYLWDSITNAPFQGGINAAGTYQAYGQAAVTMMLLAMPGDPDLVAVKAAIMAAVSNATGVSEATGGMLWHGTDGLGNTVNAQQFAVF